MNFPIKLLVATLCLTFPLIAQEKEAQTVKEARHPAVVAVITWAEEHQADKADANQRIFLPRDILVLKKIAESGDDVAVELRELVISEKENLSFKANNENLTSGFLISKGLNQIPVKKDNDRWVCDLPGWFNIMKFSAQQSTAKLDIQSFTTLVEQYRVIGGHYPSEEQGLASLVKKPTTPPRPRRWVQSLRGLEALKDPWGNPYQYKLVDEKPVITSLGPDGEASDDDISRK
ncbi:type II secretion system protein GspG [Verrucomicrobiaceae bacterium 227]